MGRHHPTQEAATEERMNRRRSTTHDADEDVQELKGQAKGKGRDLDTKAGNANQATKDVALDSKSKAKQKGRDAEDTAQDLKEDAKDTAASAKDQARSRRQSLMPSRP
jgi:gas vesicle protein